MAKSKDPLEKVTLNLVEGDKDTLAAFHPDLGWSVALRQVVHNYCTMLREEEEKIEKVEPSDITVPRLNR